MSASTFTQEPGSSLVCVEPLILATFLKLGPKGMPPPPASDKSVTFAVLGHYDFVTFEASGDPTPWATIPPAETGSHRLAFPLIPFSGVGEPISIDWLKAQPTLSVTFIKLGLEDNPTVSMLSALRQIYGHILEALSTGGAAERSVRFAISFGHSEIILFIGGDGFHASFDAISSLRMVSLQEFPQIRDTTSLTLIQPLKPGVRARRNAKHPISTLPVDVTTFVSCSPRSDSWVEHNLRSLRAPNGVPLFSELSRVYGHFDYVGVINPSLTLNEMANGLVALRSNDSLRDYIRGTVTLISKKASSPLAVDPPRPESVASTVIDSTLQLCAELLGRREWDSESSLVQSLNESSELVADGLANPLTQWAVADMAGLLTVLPRQQQGMGDPYEFSDVVQRAVLQRTETLESHLTSDVTTMTQSIRGANRLLAAMSSIPDFIFDGISSLYGSQALGHFVAVDRWHSSFRYPEPLAVIMYPRSALFSPFRGWVTVFHEVGHLVADIIHRSDEGSDSKFGLNWRDIAQVWTSEFRADIVSLDKVSRLGERSEWLAKELTADLLSLHYFFGNKAAQFAKLSWPAICESSSNDDDLRLHFVKLMSLYCLVELRGVERPRRVEVVKVLESAIAVLSSDSLGSGKIERLLHDTEMDRNRALFGIADQVLLVLDLARKLHSAFTPHVDLENRMDQSYPDLDEDVIGLANGRPRLGEGPVPNPIRLFRRLAEVSSSSNSAMLAAMILTLSFDHSRRLSRSIDSFNERITSGTRGE